MPADSPPIDRIRVAEFADTLAAMGFPASSPASPAAATVPSSLSADGRYQRLDVLGRGGMGEVLLTRDKRIGRELAVKVANTSLSVESRRRFLREALLQGRLEHPAFVPVYDVATDPSGEVFFTMRRVRGRTLRSLLDNPALDGRDPSLHRLLAAFVQLCLAVDFAHTRGVVHRDIKPENVMLGDFGEIYLLDWGIAKVIDEPEGDRVFQPGTNPDGVGSGTVEGSVLGTLGYMAPEQLRGEHSGLDGRADVYSLGAVLFEILTHERMHAGSNFATLVASTLGTVERSPARRCPQREIAPELDAICQRATALDRDERFPNARALSDAIEAYLEGDRDRSLRKKRADDLADRARDALDANERAGLEQRVEAGRRAAQALAFEPEHERARDVLVRALTDAPAETPPEVIASVEAGRAALEARTWRTLGSTSLALKVLVLGLIMAVGIWQPWLVALATSLGVGGTLLLLVAARQRGTPTAARLAFLGFAMQCGENALFTRWVSPIVAVPLMTMSLVLAIALYAPPRLRPLQLVLGGLAIVAPFVLERAGLISPTIVTVGTTFAIAPRMAALPTWFPWVPVVQFVIALAGFSELFRTSDQLRAAETRVQTQAWLLRRVLTPG